MMRIMAMSGAVAVVGVRQIRNLQTVHLRLLMLWYLALVHHISDRWYVALKFKGRSKHCNVQR
jgi:hypothetical protein